MLRLVDEIDQLLSEDHRKQPTHPRPAVAASRSTSTEASCSRSSLYRGERPCGKKHKFDENIASHLGLAVNGRVPDARVTHSAADLPPRSFSPQHVPPLISAGLLTQFRPLPLPVCLM